MKAILAVNNLGYIGLNDGLPWRCKADFQHFKSLTLQGGTLLVGYNTHRTLPPLKDRVIILDTSRGNELDLGVLSSIDWCIGGKKTYEKYAPYFTELHISHINDNSLGDTMQPDWFQLNPLCKIFNYHFEI
jgi:dihydrofolate reductase